MNYSEKQNTDNSLSLLFFQRKSYKKSKLYRNCYVILLAFYLILLIINRIYHFSENLYSIILFFYFILTIIFLSESKKYSKLGADVQDIFDRELFGIIGNIDSRINVNNIKLKSSIFKKKYLKKYIIETNRDGKKGGLRDWYNIPEKEDKLIPIYCQLQNSIWSLSLAKIILIFNVFLFSALLIVLFIIFGNKNLYNLFNFLLSIASFLLVYITSMVNSIKYYYKRKKLANSFDNLNVRKKDSKKKIMEKVNDIQITLYDYRKNNYLASDLLYNLLRKKYHDVVDDYLRKIDLLD